MAKTDKKVALVTGANRGIGFAIVKLLAKEGFIAVLTARDEKKGRAAAEELLSEGIEVPFHKLDVTAEEDIKDTARWLESEYGRLDVLANNAGVFLDKGGAAGGGSAMTVDLDVLRDTMEVNVYGPLRLARELAPLMEKTGGGRIINMSSGLGRLSDMSSGFTGYRVSKTAINALTRILASELSGAGIVVNSASPGWVATDMGGHDAPLTPEQGADTVVWLATMDDPPTGGFFAHRERTEW